MAKRIGKSYNVVSKYERDKSLPTLGELLAYFLTLQMFTWSKIADDDLDLNI